MNPHSPRTGSPQPQTADVFSFTPNQSELFVNISVAEEATLNDPLSENLNRLNQNEIIHALKGGYDLEKESSCFAKSGGILPATLPADPHE